ncbi:hypothetical protein HA402_000949 [Bradysia odoriphaga]|nr:hypothetical protein HA402_000949 [Bradysia odoriphaga]
MMAAKMSRWKSKIECELLNILIAETSAEMSSMFKRLKSIDSKLNNRIPRHIIAKFNSSQEIKCQRNFDIIRERQKKKFDSLMKEKMEKLKSVVKSNWIQNISDTNIPDYVGPNFGLPYEHKRLPIIKTLSDVENALYNNPLASEIRTKVINITKNFLNNFNRAKNADKFLLIMFNKTRKFLKENQQFVVIKSDKCKKTIVMNKSEYERSMNILVNDSNKYKKTNRNPTVRIEKAVNDMIKHWRLTNRIDDEQERYLQTHNSITPAIYGLGKLHKYRQGELIPLRPVVATVQSPTYKISELLSKTFSQIIHTLTFMIKDSWQFSQVIRNTKVPRGYKMFSLDATSLYTNIPKELCIHAIKKRWHLLQEHTFLSKEQFMDAVKLIIDESYFRYGDSFYLQMAGVAMGNSISGFLADLVMEDLELHILNKLPYIIPFYRRFVDDILMLVDDTHRFYAVLQVAL